MFDKWGRDSDIALGHTSVLPKAYLRFAGVAVMNNHKLRTYSLVVLEANSL